MGPLRVDVPLSRTLLQRDVRTRLFSRQRPQNFAILDRHISRTMMNEPRACGLEPIGDVWPLAVSCHFYHEVELLC